MKNQAANITDQTRLQDSTLDADHNAELLNVLADHSVDLHQQAEAVKDSLPRLRGLARERAETAVTLLAMAAHKLSLAYLAGIGDC